MNYNFPSDMGFTREEKRALKRRMRGDDDLWFFASLIAMVAIATALFLLNPWMIPQFHIPKAHAEYENNYYCEHLSEYRIESHEKEIREYCNDLTK